MATSARFLFILKLWTVFRECPPIFLTDSEP
jgi:hypothetical protein